MTLVIIILFLAVGIGFLFFFIVKSAALPKRADALGSLVKKGKTQVAIRAAKAILAKEPKNADARYFLGKAYLADGKSDLAFSELKALSQSGARRLRTRLGTLSRSTVSKAEPAEGAWPRPT